ncbi:MAG: ribonuclease HII [Ignavibacteria bacterium]|nr:ribonuclease HII [Ignavibacteria bacterium]
MLICGIDEAGRGPLAGPVVAAAVILKDGAGIEGAADSKKLNESQREEVFARIVAGAEDLSVGTAENNEIDEINILRATMKAMQRAISGLRMKPDLYLIDGNYFRLEGGLEDSMNYRTVVKGDAFVHEISCASIIAKVTRDRIMKQHHKAFPEYGFWSNKGYPTKSHIEVIRSAGICSLHRVSFCRKFLSQQIIRDEQMHI